MNTFATIVASLEVRLARIRDVAIAHLTALKQSVSTILVDARRKLALKAASARQAIGAAFAQVRDHTAPAVAIVVDSIRPARERLVALLPPFRRGFALAASLPAAFIRTQVVLGAAGVIGVGMVKLALVAILADILVGLLPRQSRTVFRLHLRGTIAASLLAIALASATAGQAIDPRGTAPEVKSASAATSPVVAAHDMAVAPESEDLVPVQPADRRSRRRAASVNGRA